MPATEELELLEAERGGRPAIVSISVLGLACIGEVAYIASAHWRICTFPRLDLTLLFPALFAASFIIAIIERSRVVMAACVCAAALSFFVAPNFQSERACITNIATQSSLRNALVALKTVQAHSRNDFTPEAGKAIEPSLDWVPWTGQATGAPKQVQVRVIDADTTLLLAYNDYGHPWCLLDSPAGTTYGESDSGDPADCAGEHW